VKKISFRDPSGFIYFEKEKIFRKVSIEKLNFYEDLFSQNWYKKLVEEKKIQDSKIIEKKESYFIIEHEYYKFNILPHEMCDFQLYKSALLTIDIAIEALKNNIIIKDASAWNTFFVKSYPIFCDIGSFEKWNESQNWFAYGQFFRHFLIPLTLSKELEINISEIFMNNRDGVKPEIASKLLGIKKFTKIINYEGIILPLLFKNKKIKNKKFEKNISKKILNQTLERLKKYTIKLKPKKKNTTWSNYEVERDHYSKLDLESKFSYIKKIAKRKFDNVIDIGCNEGEYSKIFEKEGSNVVSTDFDNECLNNLCKTTQDKKIWTYKVNIAYPTPAIGWGNKEHDSFLYRMKKKFDLVLALGLIHHLLITERIPLKEIFEILSEFTNKYAIMEFIPPNDEKFKQLAGYNLNLYNDYNQINFEEALKSNFKILDKHELKDNKRILYFLELI